MKTLEEIITWLKTPYHNSVLLVEVSEVQGGASTLYLSSKPYVTSPSDTQPNTRYDPCVVGGVSFNESLSTTNTVNISYGDIEVDNTNGVKDAWFDYIMANRPVNIFIGDVSWPRTDFRNIFSGILEDITSRGLSSINLVIFDKLQKLNGPISEALLPQVNTTTDVTIPVVFGEVFNITPIVTDTIVNTLEYQVHTGAIEDIIEVRDNGVPVSITKNVGAGKFSLNQNLYGQITCSVQGHKSPTYYNDVANLVKEIVKNYGPVDNRFTDADIDLSNFSTFAAANTQPVGIFAQGGDNVLSVANQLASSIGAQVSMSSLGLLRLVKLALPSTGTAYSIGSNDIEDDSVIIQEKPEVSGATKIAYCKNWTTQVGTNIAGGVPSQNLTLFETEWLYETNTNSGVVSSYRLTTEPEEEQTMLLTTASAVAESARRTSLWGTARYIYTVKCYAHLLPVELGDAITLTDSRFGLSAGKTGLAISIARDWLKGRINIGVLI